MSEEADHLLKKLGEAVVRYWTVLPPGTRAQVLDHLAPRGSMYRIEVEKFIHDSQAGIERRDGPSEPDYQTGG